MIARCRSCLLFGWNALLVLGGAACGKGTAPEDIPEIDGPWTYTETVSLDGGEGCTTLGILSLSQDFDTFVGGFVRTITCSGPLTKPSTRSESGSIPRGRVTRSSIEFRLGDCDYRGVVATQRPDRLTGTSLCATLSLATSRAIGSAGAWLAERLVGSTP
jgi:hypothetical protein